ncbi:MAG: hypothetical protein QOD74_1847 [Variibacter sp.]|nr:hypothetical protein [Variibacter sp.]
MEPPGGMSARRSRNPARCVTLGLLALVLPGCIAADRDPPSGQPSFYNSMANSVAKLDAHAAQSMISGYRRNNGLGAVTLDPTLMRMAEEQARAMAARNKMEHDVAGSFHQRISSSGYAAGVAAENIGAGYHTLAEAFSGWRDSPGHRANMLKNGVTHIGIAAVYAPQSKYKVFWALVLAAPESPRPKPTASWPRTSG